MKGTENWIENWRSQDLSSPSISNESLKINYEKHCALLSLIPQSNEPPNKICEVINHALLYFISLLKDPKNTLVLEFLNGSHALQELFAYFRSADVNFTAMIHSFLQFFIVVFPLLNPYPDFVYPVFEKLLTLIHTDVELISIQSQTAICEFIIHLSSLERIDQDGSNIWNLSMDMSHQSTQLRLIAHFTTFQNMVTSAYIDPLNICIQKVISILMGYQTQQQQIEYELVDIRYSLIILSNIFQYYPAKLDGFGEQFLFELVVMTQDDQFSHETFQALSSLIRSDLYKETCSIIFSSDSERIFTLMVKMKSNNSKLIDLYHFLTEGVERDLYIPSVEIVEMTLKSFDNDNNDRLVSIQILFIVDCYMRFSYDFPLSGMYDLMIDVFSQGDTIIASALVQFFVSLIDDINSDFTEFIVSHHDAVDVIHQILDDPDNVLDQTALPFAHTMTEWLDKYAKL